MILIDNFAGCASMAPEFASEILLRAFSYLAGEENNPFTSMVTLIDDNYARRFILEAEDIHTQGRIEAQTFNTLSGYLKGVVAALEDCEFLCGFDSFGEFILNQSLKIAQKYIKKEHIHWDLPGTCLSRERFFNAAMAICRRMNTMVDDDEQYDELDFAKHLVFDFCHLDTLINGTPTGDLLFRHHEDAVISWDAARVPVPQFSMITYSISEVYGEEGFGNSGGNNDKMTSFEMTGG